MPWSMRPRAVPSYARVFARLVSESGSGTGNLNNTSIEIFGQACQVPFLLLSLEPKSQKRGVSGIGRKRHCPSPDALDPF